MCSRGRASSNERHEAVGRGIARQQQAELLFSTHAAQMPLPFPVVLVTEAHNPKYLSLPYHCCEPFCASLMASYVYEPILSPMPTRRYAYFYSGTTPIRSGTPVSTSAN